MSPRPRTRTRQPTGCPRRRYAVQTAPAVDEAPSLLVDAVDELARVALSPKVPPNPSK